MSGEAAHNTDCRIPKESLAGRQTQPGAGSVGRGEAGGQGSSRGPVLLEKPVPNTGLALGEGGVGGGGEGVGGRGVGVGKL